MKSFLSLALALLLAAGAQAQTVEFFTTGEEFTGPFASWKDVKRDYGAKGDGVADDAPAIQKALDDLRDVPRNTWATLYFPAGTYRIGSPTMSGQMDSFLFLLLLRMPFA